MYVSRGMYQLRVHDVARVIVIAAKIRAISLAPCEVHAFVYVCPAKRVLSIICIGQTLHVHVVGLSVVIDSVFCVQNKMLCFSIMYWLFVCTFYE